MRLLVAVLLLFQTSAYDPGKDMLYRAYLIATIVGVIGAVGGVIVIAIQTCFLRQSTNAAKDAAKAAKASSDALMDAEHAILAIEMIQRWDQQDRSLFSYRVLNSGKTVGIIYAPCGTLQLGDSADIPPDTSVYVYKPENRINELLISPDAPTPTSISHGMSRPQPKLTDMEKAQIGDRTKFLWACGYFRYQDIFGRRFERRYCYRGTVPFAPREHVCIAGPAEYNRLTHCDEEKQ